MAGVLARYRAEDWGDTDDDAQGGNVDTGAPLDEETEGGLIPDVPIGSVDVGPWHYPLGLVNEGDAAILNCRFYLLNGLLSPLAQGTWQLQADGPCSDWVRVTYRLGGAWTTELKQCNGITPVSGDNQMDAGTRPLMEVCNSSGTALVQCTANIRLIRGIQLGYAPRYRDAEGNMVGATGATGEHLLGMDLEFNSDLGTLSRLTPPEGVDFSQAYSLAAALQVPGADFAVGDEFKLWLQSTGFADLPERIGYIKPLIRRKSSS